MHRVFDAVGRLVERRPVAILAAAAIVTLLAVVGVSGIRIVTTQDAFVSRNSTTFRDYLAYDRAFGGDSMYVLVPGSPQQLASTQTLQSLADFQGRLSKDPGVRSAVSPLTLLQAAAPSGATALSTPGLLQKAMFQADGQPQPAFARLLPKGHALVVVTLAGGMSVDQQKATSAGILSDVKAAGLPDGTIVAGMPRLINDITHNIVRDMTMTGSIAVILMIVVLYVAFPVRRRLLALPVVLLGVLWTFGITAALGMSLTLVTMAGLPVLIGLGVDFAIQFHNRYEEELHLGGSPATAMATGMRHIGPAVGTAVTATILGFITLMLSQVPAVRDFGLLLAIGVGVLYAAGLFGLNALLYRFDRPRDGATVARQPSRWSLGRVLPALSRAAVRRGALVMVLAVALAVVGFAVDGRIGVQTSIEKLIPSDTPGAQALRSASAVLGSSSSVPLLVRASDVTSPSVVEWMATFSKEVEKKHSQVVSVDSLASYLPQSASRSQAEAKGANMSAALTALPPAIRSGLVTSDHRGASLTINVSQMPIAELRALIREIVSEANPPSGVTVVPGGTMTLAAEAVGSVTNHRLRITLIGFAAVFVGLLLVYRDWRRAIVPLVPVVLVTGWSSAVMWLVGIELNPLTAVMGAMIIGIGTEFAVLLLGRYWEERAGDMSTADAMRQAVAKVGPAVTASALTVTAGFGALLASSFPALREFGAITVIDVMLALVATLVVLPPVTLWVDKRARPRAVMTPAAPVDSSPSAQAD